MVREGLVALNGYLRLDDALKNAVAVLADTTDSPRLDAEVLLARALDVPRSYLFSHADDEMDPAAVERFMKNVARRADGVPIAYITGEKEFWSMRLQVGPDTLVPRPETEVLVDRALQYIPSAAATRVLDLGTGSGAIALAIAKERPLCIVVATDANASALAVARHNARQLRVPNITFLEGDWLQPLAGKRFDVIVSNPPYVAANDACLDELRHEPQEALIAGADGLDAIRHISAEARNHVTPNGVLLLEHGAAQAESVAGIMRADGWTDIVLAKDFGGLPRVTIGMRNVDSG